MFIERAQAGFDPARPGRHSTLIAARLPFRLPDLEPSRPYLGFHATCERVYRQPGS